MENNIKNYQSPVEGTQANDGNIPDVDVIVTSECIHLYFLSIVTQCLFRDVFESCHAPMFRSGSFYNEKVMSSHSG